MLIPALISAGLMAISGRAADQGAYVGVGVPVKAPYGFVRFCRRRPDQCEAEAAGEGAFRLTLHGLVETAPPQAAADEPASEDGTGASRSALTPAAFDPAKRGVFDAGEGRPAPIIILTPTTRRLLDHVNRRFNGLIRPMSDERAFGATNYWTLPLEDEHVAAGNCKHYALEKRKALVDAGFPSGALSLALVRTPAGELHAVLIVSTDQGDLVLDNLNADATPWRRLGYRWLVRQAPGRPLDWVSVPLA